MFFSFDGVDGVGKSTQAALFCRWLREQGRDVVACRDPGGTALGEAVRGILLHSPPEVAIDRRAEMLLYMAARAQLAAQVIRPALAAGQDVVCDRFLLANIVYQGHAGGLDPEDIRRAGRIAVGELAPDLTFVLDMGVEAAIARLARPPDRMEQSGPAFLARVREGFLTEARREPRRIVVIDAAQKAAAVELAVRAAAKRVL